MSLRNVPKRLINTLRSSPRYAASRSLTTVALPIRPTLSSVSSTPIYAPVRYSSSTPHGDPSVDPSITIRDFKSDGEYHDVADEDMDKLHEGLEILCEDFGSGDWEVEYSSGVMTLTLPGLGTYVINKQPPNHQIWVSSPVSGPSRFSYSPDGIWVHHRRAGVQLGALLDSELRTFLKDCGKAEGWEGVGLQ